MLLKGIVWAKPPSPGSVSIPLKRACREEFFLGNIPVSVVTSGFYWCLSENGLQDFQSTVVLRSFGDELGRNGFWKRVQQEEGKELISRQLVDVVVIPHLSLNGVSYTVVSPVKLLILW